MTEQEYNQKEGNRRSDLWRMEESAEKYRWCLDHPAEQTPAMAFGVAAHKMMLEPATFGDEYAIAPNVDKRTKEGKAEWAAFCEQNAGKTALGQKDADTRDGMEEALLRCRMAKYLLRGPGETEEAFFWTDGETGEPCKIRCDRLVQFDDRLYVVDYKTTTNARTERFNHDIWKPGYHMQAGMYTEGVMAARGLEERPGFLFVAQEKDAPYSVNVIEVSDDVMAAGVAKFHELLRKMHECREIDLWPGYVDDLPNETTLPGWYSLSGEEEE